MTGAQSSALQALRVPNFANLWIAQLVSRFGDQITLVALAFVAWRITHSALSTALAVVLATVPYAVFGFFAGAIADAVGRRRAMIACDLLRFVLIGAIPPCLVLGVPLGVVYVLVLAAAFCAAVFNPARFAIVPDIVSPVRLAASNSLVYASDRAVEIVGSLAAGLMVALLGDGAFYVDAITFAISGVLITRMRLLEPAPTMPSWRSIWDQAATGARFLRGSEVLWTNTVFSLVAQLPIPVFNGLTPVFIFSQFGGGAAEFGAAEAVLAAGAVSAGLLMPSYLAHVKKGIVLVVGFVAYGLSWIVVSMVPSLTLAMPLFFAVGVSNVAFFIPNITISQEATPSELRARVIATRLALGRLVSLPVFAVAGLAGDLISVPLVLALSGSFVLIVALVGLFIPAVRDVP